MAGAAAEFVAALVGGFFVVRERDVTLTTTAAEFIRNDPERVAYLVVVTGATEAQLAFRIEITAATSIRIAGAGTTTVHIVEVVRVSSQPAVPV